MSSRLPAARRPTTQQAEYGMGAFPARAGLPIGGLGGGGSRGGNAIPTW